MPWIAEGAPHDHRRASAGGGCGLRVGARGQGHEQTHDRQDDGRQAEGVERHHAQREVERGGDRAVDRGEQGVLAVRPHLGGQLLAEIAGVLKRLGVRRVPFDQDDLAAPGRCRDRLVHLVERHERPVHHQADLAEDQQPGHQEQNLLVGPAVGPQGVALLNHVVQDDLPAGL